MLACSGSKSSPSEPGPQTAQAKGGPRCGLGLDISPDATVAQIDGKKILCSELMARSKSTTLSESIEFDQRIHDIHEQNLSELVSDYVLQSAADKAGLSVEKFVAANVTVEPTGEEEMRSFYAQALAAGEKLPAFEEVQSDLQDFLTERKQKAALMKFRADLRDKAKIEIDLPMLLPDKLEVEALGNSKGPDDAKVTIVEFFDFECGYCRKVEPTLVKVLATYGDKVRLVARDFPLPNHSAAPKAAEASECAAAQGKYWEMRHALFADPSKLSLEGLDASAQELGLDKAAFDACMASGEMQSKILASVRAGNELGVTGTPAFFINGRPISGAQPFERFAELIDYELAAK